MLSGIAKREAIGKPEFPLSNPFGLTNRNTISQLSFEQQYLTSDNPTKVDDLTSDF